jgi:hypothetical protein
VDREGQYLMVLWRELGGPTVGPSTRRGFGSFVLQDVARHFGFNPAIDYPGGAFRYRMHIDLAPFGVARAEGGVSTKAPQPAEDYALAVEASQIDVASAIRSIDGVRNITCEDGGIWLVEADRDIRAAVARQTIVAGGVLTMLIGRAAAGRLKLRPPAIGLEPRLSTLRT